jgi:hypothetical protein
MPTAKRRSRASRPSSRRYGNSDGLRVLVHQLLEPYVGNRRRRIRLFYGDPKTGHVWDEENDVTGFIGRSTGREPILLLLATAHSTGGGAILMDNVLRILVDGREVYRHPKYKEPIYSLKVGEIRSPTGPLPYEVWRDGKNIANFPTARARQRWLDFMHGQRATK